MMRPEGRHIPRGSQAGQTGYLARAPLEDADFEAQMQDRSSDTHVLPSQGAVKYPLNGLAPSMAPVIA